MSNKIFAEAGGLTLGEIVGVLRKGRKLTQAELGKQAGVHRNTISAIEHDDMSVTIGTLLAVLDVLGRGLEVRLRQRLTRRDESE